MTSTYFYATIECLPDEDDDEDEEVTKEIRPPDKCSCTHPDACISCEITRDQIEENQKGRKTCCRCNAVLQRLELAMSAVMRCPECER